MTALALLLWVLFLTDVVHGRKMRWQQRLLLSVAVATLAGTLGTINMVQHRWLPALIKLVVCRVWYNDAQRWARQEMS